MRGEVFRLRLPQPSGTRIQLGDRPGVIIRSFPAGSVITVVPGTSSISPLGSEYIVRVAPTRRNGLTSETTFRAFQITTIDRWRAVERIGVLAKRDFDLLMDAISRFLDNR